MLTMIEVQLHEVLEPHVNASVAAGRIFRRGNDSLVYATVVLLVNDLRMVI